MITLIVGKKGTGKTKVLLDMVAAAERLPAGMSSALKRCRI